MDQTLVATYYRPVSLQVLKYYILIVEVAHKYSDNPILYHKQYRTLFRKSVGTWPKPYVTYHWGRSHYHLPVLEECTPAELLTHSNPIIRRLFILYYKNFESFLTEIITNTHYNTSGLKIVVS